MIAIAAYLVAIVAANLTTAAFGPVASIPVAFALIGADLTLRDRIHDAWQGRQLWPRMAALIATGSVLSWLANPAAGQVAVASAIAFGAASATDAGVYRQLGDRPWLVRANGSNIPAAAVDSIVFPTIAFGAILPAIIFGQLAAKIAGGFVWSLVLAWIRYR